MLIKIIIIKTKFMEPRLGTLVLDINFFILQVKKSEPQGSEEIFPRSHSFQS